MLQLTPGLLQHISYFLTPHQRYEASRSCKLIYSCFHNSIRICETPFLKTSKKFLVPLLGIKKVRIFNLNIIELAVFDKIKKLSISLKVAHTFSIEKLKFLLPLESLVLNGTIEQFNVFLPKFAQSCPSLGTLKLKNDILDPLIELNPLPLFPKLKKLTAPALNEEVILSIKKHLPIILKIYITNVNYLKMIDFPCTISIIHYYSDNSNFQPATEEQLDLRTTSTYQFATQDDQNFLKLRSAKIFNERACQKLNFLASLLYHQENEYFKPLIFKAIESKFKLESLNKFPPDKTILIAIIKNYPSIFLSNITYPEIDQSSIRALYEFFIEEKYSSEFLLHLVKLIILNGYQDLLEEFMLFEPIKKAVKGTTKKGETLLHLLVKHLGMSSSFKSNETIQKMQLPLDKENIYGRTCLEEALFKNVIAVNWFLELGVSVRLKTWVIALECKMDKQLLDKPIPFDSDFQGDNVYHHILYHKSTFSLSRMLKNPETLFLLYQQNKSGITPLQMKRARYYVDIEGGLS